MYFFYLTMCTLVCGGFIGYRVAKKVSMTALPQLLATFHSLVGLAAIFIAWAVQTSPYTFGLIGSPEEYFLSEINALELAIGTVVGAITFAGSLIAAGKLHGIIKGTLSYKGRKGVTLTLALILVLLIAFYTICPCTHVFCPILAISLMLGYLLIMPVGGADMPVIVSMLNSYSGWAAAGIGFTLNNILLIVVGALVGMSGAILSSIMCKGMNRSIRSVIFGGAGATTAPTCSGTTQPKGNVKLCSGEDAAIILKNASTVIVVPGYGMAVSQAQHALRELAEALQNDDVTVKYAIHPVAGRMPGHMNVLLAEANIPYEDVFEGGEINREFSTTDVVLVVGANDITNPAAKTDPTSPIYGMPVLDVGNAKTVLFIKRSLAAGYAGIDNDLFYKENTMMLLGDAKKVLETVLRSF
jgi:NAD(P) transhydrogenase subunit beta